jgi:hypothetical protein
MPARPVTMSRLLVLLAALAAAMLAGTATSGAAVPKWGDISHFGEKESELTAPEPAFGVNPEDGSVWAVDLGGAGGEIRLQKFEKQAGKWTAAASVGLGSQEAPNGAAKEVEGVVFDQKEKRAYVLVTEESLRTKTAEEPVASELWAFSTVTKGTQIEPASGTKAGVLVPRSEAKLTGSPIGKKEFLPQSKEKGLSLFSPGGIAVNPTNDEILITGWVGEEKPELWAVSKEGEIKAVWDDKTKFFENCGCMSSPVVTATGKILVLGEEVEGETQEIAELPSNLSSETAPKTVFTLPTYRGCVLEREEAKLPPCPFYETEASIETGLSVGGSMALGSEGNIYLHVGIANAAEQGHNEGGTMVLSPALQEIGWTGGGIWGSATKECAVNEHDPGYNGPALVAGYEEHAVEFERGDPTAGEHAKVLELGPGGNTANCPQGSATKPLAEALGQKLASFPIADKITLSSKLQQANSLATEWEFEPGVTQNVITNPTHTKPAGPPEPTTLVEHQFLHPGTFNVVAHIRTDDLATPELTVNENVKVVAPVIQSEQATPEGETEATLKAEVNPSESATKCEFQIVEAGKGFGDASAKKITCPKAPGEEAKFVPESTKVTGLAKSTCYVFRLLAKAGAWESGQAGTEFKTGGGVCAGSKGPVVETKAASEVASTTATLNGSVNPKGVETKSCTFEYGTSLPSGKTAACVPSPGKGEAPVAVSAKVTGLTASTAYKYKVIDENTESTKAEGAEMGFTTTGAPQAPSVEELTPSPVAQTTATLKANVNPHGEATTCQFEYGTSTSYGTTVACPASPGSGNANVEESLPVTGLTPGTTYHYRVTAKNGTGTTPGADKEFKTEAPAAPVAETKAASEVASTTATLNGSVNPKGVETKSCTFEYGTSLPSAKTAPCVPAPGKGEAPVAVSAKVTGLTASTTYKYKLIDESTESKKAEGAEQSFKTAEPPSEPSVEELTPSPVAQTTATLKANVNPHGEPTTCEFEYGTTTSYGTKLACASSPGSGNANVEMQLPIAGLAAGTTYHFRVTATNKLGTKQGADKEFKTAAASSGGSPPPEIKPVEKPPVVPPEGGVKDEKTTKFVPIVKLTGSAMSVSPSGGFSLKLSCPAEETSCAGTVTLKTAAAVNASVAHSAKKAILTLATASFSISAGKLKVISLHLSAKARKLLAKTHSLRAKVTILAHDTHGASHTTTAIVTLRLAKKKH